MKCVIKRSEMLYEEAWTMEEALPFRYFFVSLILRGLSALCLRFLKQNIEVHLCVDFSTIHAMLCAKCFSPPRKTCSIR